MITENELKQIKEKIDEIEEKSGDGGYIYRGERETYKEDPYFGKVSSSLWREYRSKDLDIERVQQEILKSAKKHIGQLPNEYRPSRSRFNQIVLKDMNEAVDFEILTELQHYGGKTNLIDFTTDYLIALFFACDGHHDQEGRIILHSKEIEDIIWYPQNPRHRVVAQKSIFIRHPKGFIEPSEEETVIIPKDLKEPFIEYLKKYHDISTETIYNDLQGFIRNQNVHVNANIHFFKGFACQDRADEATTPEVKQQEYENAIKHYTESIKSKPDNTAAYNNRGNVYVSIGKFQNAIEDFNKAIEIQPDYAQAYGNRGIAYSRTGDFNRAIEDYDKAIELKPDYFQAYYNRGIAYDDIGDYNRAIEDYDKAIEIQPDYFQAYYNRGIAYDDIGDYNRAIEDYDKAIEIQPDYAKAYYNRGLTYYKIGDYNRAIEDFNKAIEIQPDDAKAYSNRGIAYGHIGDYNRAIEDFNKAIEIQPDDAKAYSNRGEVWLHLKDWEKAKADLITAKDMGTDIVASFRNDYESVADFEQKTGIQLPEDIAAMLTPP